MFQTKSILLAGLALAALFVSNGAAQAQEIRLETRLTGTTLASGKARFEQRSTRMKFDVEIQDARANTSYGVIVRRGTSVIYQGTIRTDAFGRGKIDLDTTNGHVVPRIQRLDTIAVNLGTTRILGGTF
jgi:hypothetical protein